MQARRGGSLSKGGRGFRGGFPFAEGWVRVERVSGVLAIGSVGVQHGSLACGVVPRA